MFQFKTPQERYFDWWAKSYERDLKKYQYCVPEKMFDIAAPVLNQLSDQEPLEILDIGIGTGLTAQQFKQSNKNTSVTGIDVSEKMLRICRDKKRADRLYRVNAAQDSLPFQSNSFDVVLLGGVLEYVDNPTLLFSEISRVLTPYGYAVMAYETPKTIGLYRSGMVTGVIDQSAEKTSLRRCIRDGFLYRFYTKYLHETKNIKLLCQQNNMNVEKIESFEAYKWSDKKVILYDLLLSKIS